MRNSLLRPFLILEFLVAIDAVFTLWSEVGGQYHLDLMFWPWKLAIGLGASALIVLITAQLARNQGQLTPESPDADFPADRDGSPCRSSDILLPRERTGRSE